MKPPIDYDRSWRARGNDVWDGVGGIVCTARTEDLAVRIAWEHNEANADRIRSEKIHEGVNKVLGNFFTLPEKEGKQ